MIHSIPGRGNTLRSVCCLSNSLVVAFVFFVVIMLPVPARADDHFSPELIRRGKQTYLINCSRCHGVGLVNPVGYTFDLRRFPPKEHSRFLHSVTYGKGNMPAWGDLLKPAQIEALWAYIKTEGAKQRK